MDTAIIADPKAEVEGSPPYQIQEDEARLFIKEGIAKMQLPEEILPSISERCAAIDGTDAQRIFYEVQGENRLLNEVSRNLKSKEQEEAAEAAGLEFASGLGALARGERAAPRQIVDGLVIEGKIHWLAGHPGHGKTTMGMHVAVEHMNAGGHVIWLDWEAGEVPTVERLMAAGARDGHVDDENPEHLFHLSVSPPLGADAESFAHVAAALDVYPGALVIFDSASKALGAAGLDENNPTEATKWTTNIVIPTREAGATVIVIDHVVKGATKQTPYARGAGSKLADTDVSWYVEAVHNFDRETVGKVELTRKKDREGRLPERLAFEVGDGNGALPVRQVEIENEESRNKREAGLRGKVLAVLQEHTRPDEPCSTSQVVQMTTGRKQDVLAALGELVKLDGSGVEQKPGAHSSVLYWYDPTVRRDFEAMEPAK